MSRYIFSLTHISLDDTSFHSTTQLSNHPLSDRATPSLALPPSKPVTLSTTSLNMTSPFPFNLEHFIDLAFLCASLCYISATSFVLHKRTLKTPICRDCRGFTLPSPLVLPLKLLWLINMKLSQLTPNIYFGISNNK